MITQLHGRLIEKNPTYVVIDCHGVGYEVNISLHTYGQIGSDENIRLHTHLQIREDAHTLYGFLSTHGTQYFSLINFYFRNWSKHRSNHAVINDPGRNTTGDCARRFSCNKSGKRDWIKNSSKGFNRIERQNSK